MSAPTDRPTGNAPVPTGPPPGHRRFIDAVRASGLPVVAEIKRRAADGRDLLRTRSAREMADRYAALGAPALSVVTGAWFGGTPRLLDETLAATRLPVLVKDFFTTPAQIDRVVTVGAAAVLLTAEILPRTVLPTLIDHCLARGATPFVEVATEAQAARVIHPDHCAIAVNNRDIRRRERGTPDLARSLRLLPVLSATGTPLAVSASGIASPAAARRLFAAGYQGLLVGAALLDADDLSDWRTAVTPTRHPAAEPLVGGGS